LAVPAGIVSTTGISGLALGGGTGYLTRKYGLTADNLLEADVVLADGTKVTAGRDGHEDLLWALRGGGGNFGVVTSFVFRAHPVDLVYAGPIFWDVAHAGEIMRWYREFLPAAPLDLCAVLGLKTVPSCEPLPVEIRGRRICALISCFAGPEADGVEIMNRVRRELPAPLMDAMSTMPFPTLQGMFDGLRPQDCHGTGAAPS
jgi:FAD/FMN-containing dehydrogenase